MGIIAKDENDVPKLLEVDSISSVQSVIEYEHHEVHEGNFYTVFDRDSSVDIASPKYWHIITPNTAKRCHIKIKVTADGKALVELFENPTTSDNGTALVAYNNDRNSSNTTTILFFKDPTVNPDGTRIDGGIIGAAGHFTRAGGNVRNPGEWILKQNEQYLVKVTTVSDATDVDVKIEFYEI